jgi:hypothetical protein
MAEEYQDAAKCNNNGYCSINEAFNRYRSYPRPGYPVQWRKKYKIIPWMMKKQP